MRPRRLPCPINETRQVTEVTCLVLAPPIFPGRRQPSIVGRNELNYRVRNGNGWTLVLISTNFIGAKTLGHRSVYRPGKTRTMNSSYDALFTCQVLPLVKECGDPYRIRTDVNGVRGRCLNHLTNGPGRRKLRSTRSRHEPSAFVESSLRSVAPPLPRQTLRWFTSDPHGGRWTKGRGLCGVLLEGGPLNQVYPLDTPSSGLVHLHGLEPGTH